MLVRAGVQIVDVRRQRCNLSISVSCGQESRRKKGGREGGREEDAHTIENHAKYLHVWQFVDANCRACAGLICKIGVVQAKLDR